MDTINPWLDPVEVRRLAERLMARPSEPAMSVPDAGFDDAFVGYESTPATLSPPPPAPVPQAAPQLPPRPAPQQVFQAAPAPAPEPVFQAAPSPAAEPAARTTGARGPFLDRINRFRDWLRANFSATGIFILDREGSVIFDESGHGRLHFLARSLALASRGPGAPAGNVHVKVGSGATLEVIPVETAYGCLVLGAVVPESLPPAAITAVMEALASVASPQKGA